MNRTTVVLFALVILLSHGLAIHQTSEGAFAAPYELAHVAYRLARNLVHLGSAAWNPGGAMVESYPSPLWVLLCAAAERLYLRSGLFSQVLGVVSMLATIGLLAQFSPKRMAGLVAPLLLAASGSAAAAGTSGTEMALVMLLLTAAFLAFERGWHRLLSALLALLVVARPEGMPLVLVFAVLFVLGPRAAGTTRRPPGRVFALPLIAALVGLLLRRSWTGAWLSPTESGLLQADRAQWGLGLRYLQGFLASSGSAFLLALPLALLAVGKLSATGRRALAVALVWCALVAGAGGDALPMWNALAPVLPLLFLSVQEAITELLDRAPRLAPAAWTLLLLAVGGSFLVSKTPGDLGPLLLERFQRWWMEPSEPLARAYGRPLGRQGLATEIREVERLRSLSAFLRERVGQTSTILTPWPGTVACLSRKRVFDLLGRATPAPGETRPASWRGRPRLDLVRMFQLEPDYVVVLLEGLEVGSSPVQILRRWLDHYDLQGDEERRLFELLSALSPYELISVPVSEEAPLAPTVTPRPYLLLRNRRLGLSPSLEIVCDGTEFRVLALHQGPQQVVDLKVWVVDQAGRTWAMSPTGGFVEGAVDEVSTRTGVLLYSTGPRPIQMVRGNLPRGLRVVEVDARLYNPGTFGDSPLAGIGPGVRVRP